ncbi:MAG: hypothetical protein QM778_14885 [Myxococcales bacterium]
MSLHCSMLGSASQPTSTSLPPPSINTVCASGSALMASSNWLGMYCPSGAPTPPVAIDMPPMACIRHIWPDSRAMSWGNVWLGQLMYESPITMT